MEVCYRLVTLAAGAEGGISRLAKDKLKVRRRVLLLLVSTAVWPTEMACSAADAVAVVREGRGWQLIIAGLVEHTLIYSSVVVIGK